MLELIGVDGLTQWDVGRQVNVDKDVNMVHFSNRPYGYSKNVKVTNGVADVPDMFLTSCAPLRVWAYVGDFEKGYTKIEKIYEIKPKNRPEDYIYTPEDVKTWEKLQSEIGDLSGLETEAKENLVMAINEAAKSGGESYTLPQATAEALGGVKADSAEAADTQPVRIGTDGKLYTAPGAKGDKGDTGATPNLTIGTVTTLEAGQNATASMGGTVESPVLNLGIPKGAKGEPGQGGGAWYVTVTPGNNYSATADKTAAEVYAAYEAGKAVYCILLNAIDGVPVVLPILAAVAFQVNFLLCFAGSGAPRVGGSSPLSLTVTYDGTWHYFHDELVSGELVTSVSASSTNKQVPSAKCVYDELQKRNLKQATANTLGGVKADPATADDTQPVRIDNSGKLYTAPGGTDISLGLTSASVGQIIKVKAIDESGKPTEWEAADMPSGGGERWRLVRTITLNENVTAIDISEDNDGKPFALKKIRINGNTLGTASGGQLRINVANKTDDTYSILGPYYNFKGLDTTKRWWFAESEFVDIIDGKGKWSEWYNTPDSSGNGAVYTKSYFRTPKLDSGQFIQDRVEFLHIFSNTSTVEFAAGSYIELWGVDA